MDKLAKRIRQAREKARLSQQQLGKAIGVSDKSVSAYEMGRALPSIEKLKKIAVSTNQPLTFFTDNRSDKSEINSKLANIEQELKKIRKLLKQAS